VQTKLPCQVHCLVEGITESIFAPGSHWARRAGVAGRSTDQLFLVRFVDLATSFALLAVEIEVAWCYFCITTVDAMEYYLGVHAEGLCKDHCCLDIRTETPPGRTMSRIASVTRQYYISRSRRPAFCFNSAGRIVAAYLLRQGILAARWKE
jgi:hypothetical protein